jgi:iron complex outermembrane receptor protein
MLRSEFGALPKRRIMHRSVYIRSLLLLILSVSLPYYSFSDPATKHSLSGTVKDEAGQALMGAIVSIPDLKVGTATDLNGRYELTDIPSGRYLVEVKLISYTSIVTSITISGEASKDFTLRQSAIEASEVVVTGQSKATEIRRSPVPIVAINHKYLQENLSTNIIDAIARVPGVTAVSTGPNVSKPIIRGLGYNRVLTIYDGMRQEGQQWGDEHGIEADQYSVDRVEVIKGPASLIYGSDALAGVVNLIPTPAATEGRIVGNVMGEYQGNNGMAGGSAVLTGMNKGFFWLGRVSHKEAKNYRNEVDGRVYGTGFKETDANASIGLNKHWGYSHLDLSMYDNLQSIPDGSRDSASRRFTKQITEEDTLRPIVSDEELNSYAIPVMHQRVQHYRLSSTNSFKIGTGRLAVNLGFERSVRREYSHPQAASVPGLYLKLNTYIYDLKYYLAEIKGWDVTFGLNGMYQTNDVTAGTQFIIPSYHQFDAGPFAMAKKTFGKLDISGGLRYDSRTFHNDQLYKKEDSLTGFDKYTPDTAGATKIFDPYDHTFSGASGSLGFTYNFSRHLSIKANVSRGFRSPNISEISSSGIHPGTGTFQLGNKGFVPEFSLQEDIGADFNSEHLSISASVFNNNLSNYIFNQKVRTSTGLDSEIVPGYPTFQYQQGNAQLYGGELNLDIHPHPLDWLHFENGISAVYAINKGIKGQSVGDSARYLPLIPPVHGYTELRASFDKPFKHLKNTFVKLQVEYYASQNRVYLAYGTETPTPGYTLFNASLGTDITNQKGKALFNVAIFGDNLANTAYQSHMSRLKYFEQYPTDPRGRTGIYNMGRNIGIRLSVPLDLK